MNRTVSGLPRFPRRHEPAPLIDLGTPPLRMVGHTGYVSLAGGGRCKRCRLVFAMLLQNDMCAGCAGNEDESPIGPLAPSVGKPR